MRKPWHPDHDTLATFRRRFGARFAAIFVQVLQVARENQLSRFGTVSLDGTKIHANASRHSALSYGHASTLEAQLEAEVQERLELAEAADQSTVPDGVSLPEESKRREDRLAAIAAAAKAKIEARARERFEREQAEYEAKLAKRQTQEKATGKKPGGKPPEPPQPGPRGRSNQPDRRRVPHHEGRGRRIRAERQCPSDGRHRVHADHGPRCDPSGERQRAGRADDNPAPVAPRGPDPDEVIAGRYRLLQREECRNL